MLTPTTPAPHYPMLTPARPLPADRTPSPVAPRHNEPGAHALHTSECPASSHGACTCLGRTR